ncbi:MAG: AAA family ATPase [Actinobacteria bacterium]|nr:AAA family ATPase [Actinomycetota bacterium]
MFLKSLTLKGFKSFADTTVMELEPGVTVVVGPNGSGKSNVVDAIAWVLGAQAPSSVRSQKMDDVIFVGTSKRPALGRAEVMLTIDNSAGLLPIDFTEVTVSRVLFRSGESEYAINGVECRLLDVQELLSDAGVGRQQHVIVSQGQIDAVLNARPEDRRGIIEEAAGVLKHRKRKEKAERRLEGTEANLMRAQDLLREVRRNLRPLERQAESARRHGALIGEMRLLQMFLAGRELQSFQARLTNLANDKLAGEEAERGLRAKLSSLDTAVMAAEAQLSARGDSGVNDELVRIEQLRGRARGLLAVLAERRRSVERDRGQLMDSGVIATLEADAANLRSDLAKVAEQIVAVEAVSATGATDQGSTLEEAQVASQKVAELSARVRGLNEEIDRLRNIVATDARNETELAQRLVDADAARVAAESAVDSAQSLFSTAQSDASTSASRAESLQLTLDANGTSAASLRDIEGTLGALSGMIDIDTERRVAVQVALGDALSAVVAQNVDAARRALQELRQTGAMGAVLALNAITTVPSTPLINNGTSLRSHVRAKVGAHETQVNRLLDVLLSRVVFVQSWADAVEAALAHPEAVVITGDGDRFASSGMRVGTSNVTASALEEAHRRAERAKEALGRAESDLATARTRMAQARDTHATALTLLERHRSSATETNARLSFAYDSLRSVQAELQGLLSVLRNDLEVKSAGLQERRQFLQSRLSDVEARLNADVEARNAAAERRNKIEIDLSTLVRLSTLVEKHSATLDARQAELQEIRRRQSDEVRAISQRLDEARKDRTSNEQLLEERRERNRRVEIEEAEVRMRLEATIEALRRDHSVEPQAAIDTHQPELPEGTSPIARVRELERELRLMGPINPLALEEFDELQKRHTFLEEQLEDVKNTRRELIKVIKQVDLEIQSTFASAFADVRDNFEKLFSMLFPGGQGKLLLTSPDDLLNTGIEVEAKPSGKNVKKLSLLSGGERSLTALAFLFAVFRSRPSPFYVMDEVEASLDDVNLHRFLSLISEFRQEAQLLIVSHQKRTMEAGDCLLGVTMQPGGSSRIIVERAAAAAS